MLLTPLLRVLETEFSVKERLASVCIQDWQCRPTCRGTLRRVRVIFVAVEKQSVLYIYVCVCVRAWAHARDRRRYVRSCVCMEACVRACVWVPGHVGVCKCLRTCSLAYLIRNENAPHCIVICDLSCWTTFFDIISQTTTFSKKVNEHKMCVDFPDNF